MVGRTTISFIRTVELPTFRRYAQRHHCLAQSVFMLSSSSPSSFIDVGSYWNRSYVQQQCGIERSPQTSKDTIINNHFMPRRWFSSSPIGQDVDDQDISSSNSENIRISDDGQMISISTDVTVYPTTSTSGPQDYRQYSTPLLWLNDPRYIHPSSGQRLRTLGQYSSSNCIVDAEIVDASTLPSTVATTLHPTPLPGSFHSRGGIYSYNQRQSTLFGPTITNINDTKNETDQIASSPRELLKLEWNNGEETYFDLLWLLESSHCEELFSQDTTTLFNGTTRVTKDIAIQSTSRHNATANQQNSIPTFDYDHVMDDDGVLLHAMKGIFEKGAILIRNGPVLLPPTTDGGDCENDYLLSKQEDVVGDLGKRFSGGKLSHGSLYGDIFHVQIKANAENIAYTNVALPPHQDLTYYESKPFLQLLHCVSNTDNNDFDRIDGGESILIDAMAAAEELRRIVPDLFDVLCRREAIFLKERDGAGMISPKPHIKCDPTYGQVVEISWSPPFEGPLQPDPNISIETYVRAYQAMECILNSPDLHNDSIPTSDGDTTLLPVDIKKQLQDYARQYTWQYALQRGDILVFNNQRMLHGRRGFVPVGNGQRHLVGCYTESDATISQYRQLLRDFQGQDFDTNASKDLEYGRRNAGNGCRWI